jgi:hypothetical protein
MVPAIFSRNRYFFNLFSFFLKALDIDSTTLETGDINPVRIALQEQVPPTTLAPFELNDIHR